MADMPQRPRQHELEDESRNKFRALLPGGWVVRTIVEDYGTDLEVEIFEGGRATGLTFRVQLKATDSAPKHGRISRSGIKASSLNYWRSLDVPVLVAVYSVPANQFFVRWAHSYDDHYSRNRESKTITFSFRPSDHLSVDFIEMIPESVAFVRAANRQMLYWPMPVSLNLSQDLQGHSPPRIRSLFREMTEQTSGILSVSDGRELAVSVSIDGMTLICALPTKLRTVSFHFEDDTYSGISGVRAFAADIVVAVAVLLAKIGQVREAAVLIRAVADDSAALQLIGTRESFVDTFLGAGYLGAAFMLMEDWISSPNEDERSFADSVFLGIFTSQAPHKLTADENRRLAAALRARAEMERRHGQTARAGQTLFNIADMLRSSGEWEAALDHYDLALGMNTSYGQRGYFWRARGSVLHQLNRLQEAAVDYQRSVDFGDVPEAPLLLSETMMEMGRYADAEAISVRDNASDFYALGERMNRRVLRIIRDVVGLGTQQRSDAPEAVLEQLVSSQRVDQIVDALRRFDALDSRLWRLLTDADLVGQTDELMVAALVVSAERERSEPTLWAAAVCLAVVASVPSREVDDYCDSGLKWCGSSFLDVVEEALSDGFLGEFSEAVRQRVYERVEADRPRWPRVARLVNDDGTLEILSVDG